MSSSAAQAHQCASCARSDRLAPGFIRPSSRSTICAAPCGVRRSPNLIPGTWLPAEDDVEPHHLAGLEIDQRGIIELLLRRRHWARRSRRCSRRARARRARCGRRTRPGPRRGGTGHNRSRSSARARRRPRRASSRGLCRAWSGDSRRDICEATIELVDGGVQPLDVGKLLRGQLREARCDARRSVTLPPRAACCARSAATMLARAWSVQSARGSTIPPVVSEPTVTSGAEHQQLVVALRRRELQVGILLRLHAAASETLAAERDGHDSTCASGFPPRSASRALPRSQWFRSCLNASMKEKRVFLNG